MRRCFSIFTFFGEKRGRNPTIADTGGGRKENRLLHVLRFRRFWREKGEKGKTTTSNQPIRPALLSKKEEEKRESRTPGASTLIALGFKQCIFATGRGRRGEKEPSQQVPSVSET